MYNLNMISCKLRSKQGRDANEDRFNHLFTNRESVIELAGGTLQDQEKRKIYERLFFCYYMQYILYKEQYI